MKSSALLVRLQTKSKAIDALKERGLEARAAEIQAEQKVKNLKIAQAFKAEFDFCPVYFFYSDDSKHLLDQNWDKVSFLDSNLELDADIKFNGGTFYTAEFTAIDLRTDKSEGTPQLGFGGLIMKDSKFNQLEKPFPYYVRNFRSLPIRRKPSKVVRKMNRLLIAFYS